MNIATEDERGCHIR